MPTLNIIGAGRVGRTLGRLIHTRELATVCVALSTQRPNAREAVEFIGAGAPVTAWSDVPPADITLISTIDGALGQAADALLAAGAIAPNSVVFHCSGSKPATVLAKLRGAGASIASVHPTKSFAEPQRAVRTFKGTYCGFDGDLAALNVLGPIFEALGAHVFSIRSEHKTLYHAAAVMVSNNVTAIIDCALELYADAGVEQELAEKIISPIVQEASQLALRLGCSSALTGPISRGDPSTVAAHLDALAPNPDVDAVYRALGKRLVALSAEQGIAPNASLSAIRELLAPSEPPRGQ
ncbi:MAG: DUF2520 domain-containing protein [Gammaproteobacteria bacterium]|nr:DUF2520 domain-containing protein [Gammaproteobacteria bacterium]